MKTSIYREERKDIKPAALLILVAFFSFAVANSIAKIMDERTLGSVLRHLLPTLPWLLLIIMLELYGLTTASIAHVLRLRPSRLVIKVNLKLFCCILIIPIYMGMLIANYNLGRVSSLYVLIFLFSFTSLLLSIHYIFRGNLLYALIPFLINVPFLYFLKQNILRTYLNISGIFFPLSSIYLAAMFITHLFSESRVRHKESKSPISSLAYSFVFVCFASIIFSRNVFYSLTYYLVDIVSPFLLFVLLVKSINSTADIARLIRFSAISLIVFCFIGVYFLLQGQSDEVLAVGLHGYATAFTYMTSDNLAFVASLGIFLCILSAINSAKILKIIFIGSSIFLFSVLLATNIRSASLGTIIGLAFFALLSSRRKFKILFIMIIAVIIIISFVWFVPGASIVRLIELVKDLWQGASADDLSSGRIALWKEAVDMIKDHPIFGIGPGMWSYYTYEYGERTYYYYAHLQEWLMASSCDPHNMYLKICVEYGIVAVVLFISVIVCIIDKALKLLKKSSDYLSRRILIGMFSLLVSWLVTSIFTRSFFWAQGTILTGLIFWLTVAVILKMEHVEKKEISNAP